MAAIEHPQDFFRLESDWEGEHRLDFSISSDNENILVGDTSYLVCFKVRGILCKEMMDLTFRVSNDGEVQDIDNRTMNFGHLFLVGVEHCHWLR